MNQLRNINRMTGRRTNSKMSGLTMIVIAVLCAAYALLWVQLTMLIILFAASLLGIGIGMVMSKQERSPEDELRKSTIEQYQVPETRGALLKFAIEATQQIRPVSPIAKLFSQDAKRQVWLNEIWVTKCKKVYTTARFAMKDDAKSLSEIAQLMTEAKIKI